MQPGHPKPDTLPRPTPWPAGFAFGLTALLLGLLTSPVILIGGAALSVLSLAGWIREICLELR